MADKTKRKISLKKALLIEFLILSVVFAAFFWAELRITQRATEKKLMEKSESVYKGFYKTLDQLDEITQIYGTAMQSKVDALAYYYDHNEGLTEEDLKKLCDLYDVERIYMPDEWTGGDEHVAQAVYYTARTADGHTIAIQQSTLPEAEIQTAANSTNSIFYNTREDKNLTVIFYSGNGYILISSDPEMDSDAGLSKISDFGVELEDISTEKGQWLTINGTRYFTYCYQEEEDGWITMSGVRQQGMLQTCYVFTRLLCGVAALILTVLVTYSYYARQRGKTHEKNRKEHLKTLAGQKLIVAFVAAVVLTAIGAYYVQTLYSMSLFSVTTAEEKEQIQEDLANVESSRKTLKTLYNKVNLTEARIVSHILSSNPELRTKEHLDELSDIFDLEYIMMFDADGVETLSNSGIMGFVISDDPESQSYAFNVLKYGIPYVVQDAQPDDLTGTYHQFIGVITNDTNGQYDGFLQICISPEEVQTIIEDLSFENILDNAISMSENDVLAINKDTGNITYYSRNTALVGQKARDLGMKEEFISGNYLGIFNLHNEHFYADSFEANNHYIYLTSTRNVLFTGRITMTIFAVLVSLAAMALYMMYFNSVDVLEAQSASEDNPYIDVNTASYDDKTTLNIIARILRTQTRWSDKPSEEKIGAIIQFVILVVGRMIFIFCRLQGILYSENSIFGFIMGNRWNKGLNVFALTKSLIFILNMNLAVFSLEWLANLLMKLANPKHETILRLVKSLLKYVVVIAIIYYTLSQFGFDSRSLLASAGLLTLVVGLGAKDLVTDIVAGIFIIFENEFQVGDIIEVNGYKGRVLEIGIRTTKIMNTRQDVKSINNRNLTNIVNKTKRNSYCDVIINVPLDADIDAITKALAEELPNVREKCPYIIEGPNNGGIDDMSGRTIKLSIRTECLEEHKFDVRAAVNREIKDIFDRHGFKLS